jgi:hypothetical protein
MAHGGIRRARIVVICRHHNQISAVRPGETGASAESPQGARKDSAVFARAGEYSKRLMNRFGTRSGAWVDVSRRQPASSHAPVQNLSERTRKNFDLPWDFQGCVKTRRNESHPG